VGDGVCCERGGDACEEWKDVECMHLDCWELVGLRMEWGWRSGSVVEFQPLRSGIEH